MSKDSILGALGKLGALYCLQTIDNGNLLYLVNQDGYLYFTSEEPYVNNDYDFSKLFSCKRDGNNFTLYYPVESVESYLLKKSDFLRVPYNEKQISYYPVIRSGEWYYVSSTTSDTACVFTLNDDLTLSEGGNTLSLCGTFWHSGSRWLSNQATYSLVISGAFGKSTEDMFAGYGDDAMNTVTDGSMRMLVSRSTVGYDYLGDMTFTPNEKPMIDRLLTAFPDVLAHRDNNKDGKLGPGELTELAKATKVVYPATTVERVILEFDIDGDGKISLADINKYLEIQKTKLLIEFNKQFGGDIKALDKNGDGKIGKIELQKYANDRKLPNAISTIGKIFTLLDVNKSGFIEANELITPTIALLNKFKNDFAGVIAKYDKLKVDGKIGKTELTQMAKAEGVVNVDAIIPLLFETLDKDGSGTIDTFDLK